MNEIHLDDKTYAIAKTIADMSGISVEDFIAKLITDYARKILKLSE